MPNQTRAFFKGLQRSADRLVTNTYLRIRVVSNLSFFLDCNDTEEAD